MQLTAIHSFFAACSNSTVSHVTQSNRATRRTTYQVHLVARSAGGVARCISIRHRGIKLNGSHAIGARYVGYCTLAVGKVNGVAVGNEVFVLTVTLYGKAGVQYVINGSGIVALACQIGAAVAGRVGYGIACICQIALHVSQSGRCSSGTCCILHAGNHVTGWNFVATCRCVIEFAVRLFVHFAAVSFGVHNWGLGILNHRLGIQCIGVRLVAAGIVYILFYSQSVTGCKGYFLTRLNGGRCSVAAAS